MNLKSIALTMILTASASFSALTPRPDHFSYGFQLKVWNSSPSALVELPHEILKYRTQPGDQDIQVFTKEGIAMPQRLVLATLPSSADSQWKELPFQCEKAVFISDKRFRQSFFLQVNVAAESPDHQFQRCMIKLSNADTLSQLRLVMPDSLIQSTDVYWAVSEDMVNWNWNTQPAVLFSSRYEGIQNLLISDSINVRASGQVYLSLVFRHPLDQWTPTSIRGLQVQQSTVQNWIQTTHYPSNTDSNWHYKTPHGAPVYQMQIQAGESQIGKIRLSAAWDSTGPYQVLYVGQIFTYPPKAPGTGSTLKEITNPPIQLNGFQARYWKIEELTQSKVLRTHPALHITWIPEQIEWITSGQDQFTLAIGRHPKQEPLLQESFFEFPDQPASGVLDISSKTKLGGEARLSNPQERNYSWIVWVALAVFLGLLAFMAKSLWRELKNK